MSPAVPSGASGVFVPFLASFAALFAVGALLALFLFLRWSLRSAFGGAGFLRASERMLRAVELARAEALPPLGEPVTLRGVPGPALTALRLPAPDRGLAVGGAVFFGRGPEGVSAVFVRQMSADGRITAAYVYTDAPAAHPLIAGGESHPHWTAYRRGKPVSPRPD